MFTQLIRTLEESRAGIVAPKVVDAQDRLQATFRRVPLPHRLVMRAFRRGDSMDELVRIGNSGLVYPDWTPGICILMRSELFRTLGGFDERYFLYYEDVDLSLRCRLAGRPVVVDTRVKVIHEARFASHRRASYFLVHCASAVRFFLSRPFWRAPRVGDTGGWRPQ